MDDLKEPASRCVFVPISDDSIKRFGQALQKLVPFELDYFRPRIVTEQSGLVYHFESRK